MRCKPLIALVLLPALLFLLAACTPPQRSETQEQEAALRQAMLNWAILGQKPAGISTPFPDGQMLSRYSTIIVQDDGSPATRALQLATCKVALLDLDAIRSRADGEGDFLYLRFERVDIKDDEATIRLSLVWALSQATRDSGRAPLNGGGAEVLFKRRGTDWVADHILSAWHS